MITQDRDFRELVSYFEIFSGLPRSKDERSSSVRFDIRTILSVIETIARLARYSCTVCVLLFIISSRVAREEIIKFHEGKKRGETNHYTRDMHFPCEVRVKIL